MEELQSEAAELAIRLERAREDLSRLEITWETVTQVLAELSAAEAEPDIASGDAPESNETSAPHGVGVMMVPPWREGLVVAVLPDMYRDIVEVIADAPGPVQAKQIVPRIGLPTTTGKIEGTRGKLKRLVERGWLDRDTPGQFTLARQGPGRDRTNFRIGRIDAADKSAVFTLFLNATATSVVACVGGPRSGIPHTAADDPK
ncbi:hypothetical protein [Streptomyces sp. NPDC001635]